MKGFEEAGVPVGNTLEEVVQLAKEKLQGQSVAHSEDTIVNVVGRS